MKRLLPRSVRTQLLLLIFLAMAPMIALLIYTSDQVRLDAACSAQENGLNLARAIAADYEQQVFAIVDVWDSVTSDRPYHRAWPADEAIAYLREQAGKHLEPRIVGLLLDKIIDRGV